MSKIIFVKNSDESSKLNYDIYKAKPLDRTEDGKQI